MASKLEQFLKTHKIDPRRVIATSRQLERLRPSDRRVKLAHRLARKSEEGKKPEGLDRPRSGRPVTAVSIDKAFAGKPLSGPQKSRILRAVNRVLEQRKQQLVELGALFETGGGGKTKGEGAKKAKGE